MTTTTHWPHRAEIGRFCQWNCFQEALAPVLQRDYGIDTDAFDTLRFVGLPDLREPLAEGKDPGGFGGVAWPELGELYRIRWSWLGGELTADPGAVVEMARHRPLIAVVDRYHVPTDKVCHGKHHRMHTILLVDAGPDGVAYSDAEYPFSPARITLADLGRAVLPVPDGEGSFVVGVEDAAELTSQDRTEADSRFLGALADSLDAPAERVGEVAGLITEPLRAVTANPEAGELLGNDLASFLNAAARSLGTGERLLEAGGAPAEARDHVATLAKQATTAYRLLQMLVESGSDRYLPRLERELQGLVAAWDSPPHAPAVESLRASLPMSEVGA